MGWVIGVGVVLSFGKSLWDWVVMLVFVGFGVVVGGVDFVVVVLVLVVDLGGSFLFIIFLIVMWCVVCCCKSWLVVEGLVGMLLVMVGG